MPSSRFIAWAFIVVCLCSPCLGSDPYDLITNGGGITWVQTGAPRGAALNIDGESTMYSNGFSNYPWGSSMSIAFWLALTAQNHKVFDVFGYQDQNQIFQITFDSTLQTGNSFIWNAGVRTQSCPNIFSAPCNIQFSIPASDTGVYTHFALTHDGKVTSMYVGGLRVASQPNVGSIPTSSYPLTFGGPQSGSYHDAINIADIRIYSTALNPSEIAALADQSAPLPISVNQSLIAWYDASDYLNIGANHAKDICTVPLTVSSILPSTVSSAGGSVLTVIGSGFDVATSIVIGEDIINQFTSSPDGLSATLTLPLALPCGQLAVSSVFTSTLLTCVSNSNITLLTEDLSAPSASPPSALSTGGTNVTITSQCFAPNAQGQSSPPLCRFGDVLVRGSLISSTQLTCPSPPHTPTSVQLSISMDGGVTYSAGTPFTFLGAPFIQSVQPTGSIPDNGGTLMSIFGSLLNETSPMSCVFNQISVSAQWNPSINALQCITPSLPPGSVSLTITTPIGLSSAPYPLLYAAGSPQLSLTQVSGGGLCNSPTICQLCDSQTVYVRLFDALGYPAVCSPADVALNVSLMFSSSPILVPVTVLFQQCSFALSYNPFIEGAYTLSLSLSFQSQLYTNSFPLSILYNNVSLSAFSPSSLAYGSSSTLTVNGNNFKTCNNATTQCILSSNELSIALGATWINPTTIVCLSTPLVPSAIYHVQLFTDGLLLSFPPTKTLLVGPLILSISPSAPLDIGETALTIKGSGLIPPLNTTYCTFNGAITTLAEPGSQPVEIICLSPPCVRGPAGAILTLSVYQEDIQVPSSLLTLVCIDTINPSQTSFAPSFGSSVLLCQPQTIVVSLLSSLGLPSQTCTDTSVVPFFSPPNAVVSTSVLLTQNCSFNISFLPVASGVLNISYSINNVNIDRIDSVQVLASLHLTSAAPLALPANSSTVLTLTGSGFAQCAWTPVSCGLMSSDGVRSYGVVASTNDSVLQCLLPPLASGAYLAFLSASSTTMYAPTPISIHSMQPCSLNCGQGECVNNQCYCSPLWMGDRCQVPIGWILIAIIAVLTVACFVLCCCLRRHRPKTSQSTAGERPQVDTPRARPRVAAAANEHYQRLDDHNNEDEEPGNENSRAPPQQYVFVANSPAVSDPQELSHVLDGAAEGGGQDSV